ncbi:MAG: hypothetical protein BroJett029_10750 [Alphaproteobacteria bacterium]|nr:MAG: hypothetical protein BroJett029_10750 [Alphaproteobacteria bacterium]
MRIRVYPVHAETFPPHPAPARAAGFALGPSLRNPLPSIGRRGKGEGGGASIDKSNREDRRAPGAWPC